MSDEINISRWQGQIETRLESLEKLAKEMNGKLDGVVSKVSMAQGGWIALMAIVGMIASGAAVVIGIIKLFFGKGP